MINFLATKPRRLFAFFCLYVTEGLPLGFTATAVAATQFTAYMAILNLVIAYSAAWQGFYIEAWGYPTTLAIDATVGLLGIVVLYGLSRVRRKNGLPSSTSPPS